MNLTIFKFSLSSLNIISDQLVTKVITWKRTTSSKSSSSRNPLATKDDNDDSGSDFIEEFCMISGSHSSSLERLYAWERKLYDEVKVSFLLLDPMINIFSDIMIQILLYPANLKYACSIFRMVCTIPDYEECVRNITVRRA